MPHLAFKVKLEMEDISSILKIFYYEHVKNCLKKMLDRPPSII
jgi:hypothetical protein